MGTECFERGPWENVDPVCLWVPVFRDSPSSKLPKEIYGLLSLKVGQGIRGIQIKTTVRHHQHVSERVKSKK